MLARYTMPDQTPIKTMGPKVLKIWQMDLLAPCHTMSRRSPFGESPEDPGKSFLCMVRLGMSQMIKTNQTLTVSSEHSTAWCF